MLSVKQLNGPFGAQIEAVDLARETDADTVRQIVDLLHQNHVVLVRNQRLSKAEYARFGRQWGDPILFFRESHRNAEFPELIEIKNSPDTPERMRDGAMHWHSDSSYQKLPASVTMLYAIEAPQAGGDTLFVDMAAAYDALPDETRERIEDLQVNHFLTAGKMLEGEKIGGGGMISEEEKKRVEPPIHPLVIRHPVTGRKALYAVSGSAYGIVGMSENEGEALLLELKRHAIQERFRLKVKAEVGDILIWDNFATMHSATALEYSAAEGKRRLLYRISTTGLPLAYRH